MSSELEKVITDGRYGPLMDYATTLTDRLAQAEREVREANGEIEGLRTELKHAERERDAALAKAETAYEDAERRGYLYATLRAGIEALADDYAYREGVGILVQRLRALLQPPKPETVWEVFLRLERETHAMLPGDATDTMAKLRALLEAQEKSQ